MSRLETTRTYFIERFFALFTGDLEFATLSQPAELFDSSGAFNLPANAAGFIRMPTLAALRTRIASASSPAEGEALRQFERVLERTLSQFFGSLVETDLDAARQWAGQLAPVIRHPDSQTYWPVDAGRYLNYDDGALSARFYDKGGERNLAGNLFSVLFENPAAWSDPQPPKAPFEARTPFAATIGVEDAPPFPTSPLTAGHLNLPAADVRLTPGRLHPAVFAELKSLGAALRTNQHYMTTAGSGGRYRALKRNRIHTDPLLPETIRRSIRKWAVREGGFAGGRLSRDPVMAVFHGFYPADDGARRAGDGTGTNREFHHLAVGLLAPGLEDHLRDISITNRDGLLFVSISPTIAKAIPLNHPALKFVDDQGNESPQGTHPVIFANTLKIQGYSLSSDDVDQDPMQDSSSDGLDYNPDKWQWWVGLASATGLGALVGFAGGGPIGALIGAAVGLIIFLLSWLLKKLFGGDEDREEEWTEKEPWPGGSGGSSIKSYQQGSRNDIGPGGTTSAGGGAKPGRPYDLKVIPHLPDFNLYGLSFSGGDTFRILEDAELQEMLAWLAFEGGIGYQFDRPAPGRAEAAGTSLQNYFELFLRKYLQLQEAQAEVVYFGEG